MAWSCYSFEVTKLTGGHSSRLFLVFSLGGSQKSQASAEDFSMIALNLQIYQLEGVTMKLNDIEYEHFDAKKIPEMARNLDYIFKYNKDISKAAYLN